MNFFLKFEHWLRRWIVVELGVFCAFLLATTGSVVAGANGEIAWGSDREDLVYYIPQFSEFEEISDSEMLFFKKSLKRAAEDRAKLVILELDTPGGSVETAFKYLSLMARSEVPVVVYLNPNGISAGMIIAMGAERIAIAPGGVIGDAMPLEMSPKGVRPIAVPGKSTEEPLTTPPVQESQESQELETPAPEMQPESGGKVAPETLERLLKELGKHRTHDDEPSSDDAARQQLVDQKFLTVFFKMLQVVAEKNQRPVRVVRAMADPYLELTLEKDGYEHAGNSPLTLSAAEALQLNVVDYVVKNRSDLLHQLGVGDAKVVEIRRTPTEQIGAFLATPVIAGLLLALGLVGIFIEIKTPGFGVPGMVGITLLTLFFLGHIASGASDWGPIVIFFVGLLLLALEIFVVPGFGIVGVLGILCILISFFWSFGIENINVAVQVITTSLIVAITAMVVLAIYVLPHTPLFRKVTLSQETSRAEGFTAYAESDALIGKHGMTLTVLRPTGTVKIDGLRHDACTACDFLDAGVPVVVTKCNGFQLVVEADVSWEAHIQDEAATHQDV